MMTFILLALWRSFFAQMGLAGIVLICSVAAFLWVPGTISRCISTGVATCCLFFIFMAPKLYIEGIQYEKGQQAALEEAIQMESRIARREAENEVPNDTASAAVSGSGRGGIARILPARRVRDDRYDRDNKH